LRMSGPFITTNSPKRAFAAIASALHRQKIGEEGPEPVIDVSAKIHSSAVIGPGAMIGANVEIGANCVIGPGVVVGQGSYVGSNVSVFCSILGERARLLAGSRIGEDGFGFVPGLGGHLRIPQLGRVIIGDDVEIGANSSVDRGTLSDTVIGNGVKIDNLVQIGHNVKLGKNCIIAALVGFSGSVEIGDGVMVGGQSGFAPGVKIGSGASIAAQSGVMRDVPAGEAWGGSPAQPAKDWLRGCVQLSRLAKKR